MVSQSIVSYLVADHARLHTLLNRAMEKPELDREAFADFRRGLLRHIAIEEKLLLPAVREARGGTPLDRAHELRIDHAALTSLLVPTPDLALCHEILWLLTKHDAKEEGAGGIYEECEHCLNDGDLVRLAEQAVAFPEVRVARQPAHPVHDREEQVVEEELRGAQDQGEHGDVDNMANLRRAEGPRLLRSALLLQGAGVAVPVERCQRFVPCGLT